MTPRSRPKYLGLGPACTVLTGTMKRMPSAEATSPPPQACVRGIVPASRWRHSKCRRARILIHPREPLRAQRRRGVGACEWLEANVTGLAQQNRAKTQLQVTRTRGTLTDVRER